MRGKVKFFNAMRGFGFIEGEDGSEYFVHVTGLSGDATVKDNDEVTFDVVQGNRGPKAENVTLATGDSGASSAPAEDTEADSEEEDSADDADDSADDAEDSGDDSGEDEESDADDSADEEADDSDEEDSDDDSEDSDEEEKE